MKLSVINGAVLCILGGIGITACNGGGSDTSSNNTAGGTVVGTIAGFGSIIMDNGVKYETDGLDDCVVDDIAVAGKCEDSLAIGMHVTLQTDANGAVTALKYDDELEGVASNVTGDNGDYNFEVYGVTVTSTSPETQWHGFSTNPPTTTELDNTNVEISGEWQQDGTLIASYIEKQGSSDNSHEVKGTVTAVTGTDISITLRNGSTMDVDGSVLGQLPIAGDFIEVKGNYDSNAEIFTATDIETENEHEFDSDSEVEITGTLIQDNDSSTGLSIGNVEVDITNVSGCNNLTDSHVEVEGAVNPESGVLVVRECKIEDDDEDIEVKCQVSDNALIPDPAKPKVGSVDCEFPGAAGGPITITFNDTPDLAMFSGDSTANPFDLTDVHAGDCVEIKFSTDADGAYTADFIEHEDRGTGCDEYKLDATVDSYNAGTDITALGITFGVSSATTIDQDKAALVDGVKVKIKDNNADGISDEIEVD